MMQPEKTRDELARELLHLQQRYDLLKSSYESDLREMVHRGATLKKSEAWFRALYENTGDGIFILTMKGDIVETNKAFALMHGYQPDELQKLNISDLDTPQQHALFSERMTRLMAGEILSFESEHYHKDGHTFPLEVTSTQIDIEGTKYIVASHRDITLRKRLEKDMERLHQSNLYALRAAQMGYWQYDIREDKFLFNDQYYALHETSAHNAGGYSMSAADFASRFVHPEDSHKVKESIQQGITTTDPDFQYQFEARIRTEKGESKWITVWFCIEKDTFGNTIHMHGINQDVSARKLSEQALRESTARYKMLHETMRDCFVQTNLEGLIVHTNKSYQEMLGYDAEALLKLSYEDITPPQWHKYESEIIEKQIIPRGYSDIYEKEYIRKDGTVFPVELRTLLLKDENGSPTGFWAIIRDITARRATETALRESEERYRTLFEMESDSIFLIDNETGQILEVNTAATLLYGYSRHELLNFRNKDLSAQPEETQKATQGDPVLTSNRIRIPLRIHRKKDGTEFPVEISGYFFSHKGRPVHIAAIRDITERKTAEDKLRLSEETYRGIIDSVEEAIYIHDEHGIFLDVNKAVEKMYGYKRAYFHGKSPMFLSAPGKNNMAVIGKAIQAAYAGTPQLFEFWGITKDGRVFPKEVSLSPGLYFGKKAIIAVARDISERKHAEFVIREKNEALSLANEALFKINEKIEESEALLKQSQKIAGLGSYKLDFKTGHWTSSEVLDSIFGINNEIDNTIQAWEDLVHPDWREIMLEYFRKDIVEKHNRFDKEYKIVRKNDHKEVFVHGIGELSFDSDHKLRYMTGSIQDITLRKQSEEALSKTQANLTALIENTKDLIWAVDENYCLIISNQQFIRQLKHNFNLDVSLGQLMLFDIMPQQERDEWKSYYDRAFRGEIFSIEKDGMQDNTFFNFGFYTIRDLEGNIRGVAVSGRDISERRKLESQMLQTDRMSSLGEMAAGIAHEINQPLNNISLTIDNILFDIKEKQFVDKSYIEKKSQKLFENIIRMRNLIDHVRLFARSHEDKFRASFNVNEGIQNTLTMIAQQLKHKGIDLRIQLDKDLPETVGSIYKFEQVILNLLLNAKDGLEEKKHTTGKPFPMNISIITKMEGETIIIEVVDNGAGIDKEKLEQVFLPFFSTKEAGKGTGLGLSISFGIIKQLNGNIVITSEKNFRTKVTITLPGSQNMEEK